MDTAPLNTEHVTHSKMPRTDTRTGCMPLLSMIAIAHMASPIILPVEMSKCPDITSTVAPADTSPRPAACPRILLMVPHVRNLLLIELVTTATRMINTNSMNGCDVSTFNTFDFALLCSSIMSLQNQSMIIPNISA